MALTPPDFLAAMLAARLSAGHWQWLSEQAEQFVATGSERQLILALALIPRRLGTGALQPAAEELTGCHQVRPGWYPAHWSIAGAARVLLLCRVAGHDRQRFAELFTRLCRTADLTESIMLYQGTALFPAGAELDRQIGEGLRSNIRAVFEAIAHHNPYPQENLDEHGWNHLVLKALFIDSRLAPIQGLDARANVRLADTLCDYAHERWAAGRPVTDELWRCVGPFASGRMLDDLRRVSGAESARSRAAAALALSACPDPAAAGIMQALPDEAAAIASGSLSWESLAAD